MLDYWVMSTTTINTMLFELQTSTGLLGHVDDNNTMLFELQTSAGLLGHVNDNNTMRFDEGPERGTEARSAGVPRGVGSGEERRSPSPVWGSALPPENFEI